MSESKMLAALEPQLPAPADIQQARAKSDAVATVEAQVFMAKQYPRNEDVAYQKMIRACERPAFALEAIYSYPRGGQQVEGGSIALAREMKRCWGNMISGNRIVREDPDMIYGEAFAWDLESNTYDTRHFGVSKLIWRKAKYGKGGGLIRPAGFLRVGGTKEEDADLERDFREKFYNVASRAERETIFHVLPSDYREECVAVARDTVRKRLTQDPEEGRKLILRAMGRANVTADMLEAFLGCPVARANDKQIDQLRAIYAKMNGGATWEEAAGIEPKAKAEAPKAAAIPVDEIRQSENENRGHDAANPAAQQAAQDAPEGADEGEGQPEAQEEAPKARKRHPGAERLIAIGFSGAEEGDALKALYIRRKRLRKGAEPSVQELLDWVAGFAGDDDALRRAIDAEKGDEAPQEAPKAAAKDEAADLFGGKL